RFFMAHPHFLFGHADAVEWDARRFAGELRPRGAARAGTVCDGIRETDSWGFASRNRSELLKDLGESEIFGTEDVALADAPPIRGEEMSFGCIAHVHYVQSGVNEGGHVAIQEVEDDFAGGSWLHVVIADGGGGVHDDHRQVSPTEFQRNLLGQELRAL